MDGNRGMGHLFPKNSDKELTRYLDAKVTWYPNRSHVEWFRKAELSGIFLTMIGFMRMALEAADFPALWADKADVLPLLFWFLNPAMLLVGLGLAWKMGRLLTYVLRETRETTDAFVEKRRTPAKNEGGYFG